MPFQQPNRSAVVGAGHMKHFWPQRERQRRADLDEDAYMAEVLRALPLAEEIQRALLDYAGSLGAVLHSVLAYERGNWEEAMHLGLDQNSLVDAYLHALAWAVETRAALGWA